MAKLNLILAVFWLLVALAAFVLPAVNPEIRLWSGSQKSIGWFALVLCIYNVMRWSLTRSRRVKRVTPEGDYGED